MSEDEKIEEWRREAEEGKPHGYYESFIDRDIECCVGCSVLVLVILFILFAVYSCSQMIPDRFR